MAELRSDLPTVHYNQDDSKRVEINCRWWKQDENPHTHIKAVVDQIQQNQIYKYENYLRFARVYSNQSMEGLNGVDFARMPSFLHNRMSWNVIKACIDTVASKIAKNKPRPMYLTENGNMLKAHRAQAKSAFIQSQFMTMGTGKGDDRSLYGLGRQCFVDSGVFGLGATHFYKDVKNKKVCAERVLPHEIVIDEMDGRYRMPLQMHRTKPIQREALIEEYPKYEAEIMAASSPFERASAKASAADIILVTSSWRLKHKKVVSIENATLSAETYEKDYFPFLFQRWNNALIGFDGIGICEELIGIQLEINKILRTIAKAQHLMCVPQVWLNVSNQQAIKKKQLTNEIGGIRYYLGDRPYFATPSAISPEMYQHLENLYAKAFELIGVSQLSAQSLKPAGLDSGRALREYQDIESERFALAQLRYEDWYMDAAEITSDLNRDLTKEGADPMMKCRDADGFDRMKWGDVDIPDDECLARPYPTAFLPSTPSGQMQGAQELVESGFFDQDEALELIDFPDIKAKVREKLAHKEANRQIIELALFKGKYVTPEPYMDIDGLKPLAQRYYNRGKVGGIPDNRLELLRRLMDEVKALIEKRDAAAAPPPGPEAGLPALPPEAMPADPGAIDPSLESIPPEQLPPDIMPAA